VVLFAHFSKDHPGMFPSAVTHLGPDGKNVTQIAPVKEGADIQSFFFEMRREDHPDMVLQDVPGDLVTASGSGLDPTHNAAKRRVPARPRRGQMGTRS
jgi:potassium-transporting ATPase KdpC subunit